MSFIDSPIDLPSLAPPSLDLGATPGPGGIGPYSPQLPDQQRALERKYQTIAQQLVSLPQAQVNALIDLDATRVSRGQAPLAYRNADDDTWRVLQTSLTGKPATAPAQRSIGNVPGNVLRDLGDIVRSIPRLPLGLLEMAKDPTKATALIPGSYIAENIGNPGELARHPLMTALDVLPIAGKLAEGTKVGRAAKAAAELEGRTARPLISLATNRLDEAGNLTRSSVGQASDFLRTETRLGQQLGSMFGREARGTSTLVEQGRQQVHGELTGVLPTDDAGLIARQAEDLRARYDITPERMAELHEAITIGDPAVRRAITDERELAAITEYEADLLPRMTEYGIAADDLIRDADGEIYDTGTGALVQKARIDADDARFMATLRRSIEDAHLPGAATPDELLSMFNEELGRPAFTPGSRDPASLARQRQTGAISVRTRDARLKGVLAALDARGYDVTDMRAALRDPATGHIPRSADELATRPRMNRQEVADALSHYTRSSKPDLQVDRLLQALKQGPSKGLTRALDNLLERTGPAALPEMDNPILIDSLRRLREESKFLSSKAYKRAGEQAVLDAEASLAKTKRGAVPSRMVPLINKLTNERVVERFGEILDVPADKIPDLTQAVLERRWGSIAGMDPDAAAKLFAETRDDIADMWQELRDQGHNPTFVHVVTPGKLARAQNPMASEVLTSITSARKRVLDSTGGVPDFSVAVSQQAAEYVSRRASEMVAEQIAAKYGTPEATLRELVAPEARELMARNPRLALEDAFNEALGRTHRLFNPEELGYNWGGARLSAIDQSKVWVPKAAYENLKALHNPRSTLGGFLDPTTRLFRISVTGLSPRIHLYNILGGASMLAAEAGPRAFGQMRAARQLLRDPDALKAMAITDPEFVRALGGQAQFFKDIDFTRPSARTALRRYAETPEAVDATRQYLFGRTLRRLTDQSRVSVGGTVAGKVTGGLEQAAKWSYDLNGKVDDMYRAAAYLSGKERGVARGLSTEAAQRAGMELARRSLMDYASLTAFERNVVRSIFPFYSFTRFAIGYVLRYPFDHPLRASVMSAVARAELEDAGDTLPSRLLGTLFLGDMDDQGKQTGLNIAPINPFGDVANMMTLQGFVGSANPVISTVLEAIGVDRGTAELYPTLRYDPESGRMSAVHRNPLVALAENTIPQSQILTGILGLNKDFSRQLRSDPQSALRTMISAGGVPILWREYNVPQEEYKAELARGNSQDAAVQDAQASGEWSEALRYPGARSIFDQVQATFAANPQMMDTYRLGPQSRDEMIAKLQVAMERNSDGRPAVGAVSRGI